ncbi:cell division protein FtsK [Lactobacillus helveticus]|nr:cell division protein FtsK [Lactobacillus helveticus]MBW8036961.1 cell division protein FtsK [Lactobacillus helveticus]
MQELNLNEWRNVIKQALNLGLGSSSSNDTSSYNGSFDIAVKSNGFAFIPRIPAAYMVDNALYEQIFKIANVTVYPYYTIIKRTTMNLVEWKSDDFHRKRALWFDWLPVNHRIKVPIGYAARSNRIPIMSHFFVKYDDVTSILIAGNSGSGKSYFLSYLLNSLKKGKISDLFVVDPKKDSPARWCKAYGVGCVFPNTEGATSDFVANITEALSRFTKKIYQRQDQLYSNPSLVFPNITIVIDEMLVLTENVPKKLKDSFFDMLSTISLMGRSTNVHLILVSQRFDAKVIPVVVRQQANLKVQLGTISTATTQFLFEDLDPNGILIPQGRGTGLISFNDNKRISQVLPLETPTFEAPKGVL